MKMAEPLLIFTCFLRNCLRRIAYLLLIADCRGNSVSVRINISILFQPRGIAMNMKRKVTILTIILTLVLTGCASVVPETASESETVAEETVASTTGETVVTEVYVPNLPTGPEEADIFVTPIKNLAEDFIKGMDISSLLAEEASGVKYYDEAGNEEDLLKILADAGVNYVRIRVWVDPFDENGNGYGGGNCTADTAATIGARAARYGMKTCVDFHYSDFWADPSKQMSPKSWTSFDIEEKKQALKDYTEESLNRILDAGADVGMVQVGNETNSGVAGVKSHDNMYAMLAAGCEAVRKVSNDRNADIKVAVHFTQIDDYDGTMEKCESLKTAGADYDIFGVSYYPYWHGSFDNMEKVLGDIKSNYGVDTCVMETAYPYTAEDGDGNGNSISGDGDACSEYPVSIEGQAKLLRDVCAHASKAGALGVFYWEGAWIPVGSDRTANEKIWEQYGSGWASSFAGSYDPNDAGKYYGGCSWDNQALFDFSGHPLPSLNVFKYLKYGATAPLKVLAIGEIKVESPLGQPLVMPEKVDAFYNDSDLKEGVGVTWNQDEIDGIDTSVSGKYIINGTAENGFEVQATVKVVSVNYIKNGSFEEDNLSMWNVEVEGENNPTDIQTKASDASDGDKAFHYWAPSPINFMVSQDVSGLYPGKYTATANIQGGDMGESEDIYFFVNINGEEFAREKVSLTGWVEWKSPQISDIPVSDGDIVTVGLHVEGDAKGWGTTDEWELF